MFLPLPPFSWRDFHPIFVHFTAALVPVSFGADVMARSLRIRSMKEVAWWVLLMAVVITPLTAITGWFLRLSVEEISPQQASVMAVHQWLGTMLILPFIGLCAWRWFIFRKDASPGWLYLTCGLSAVLLTAYQGHLGGSMSFG